MQSLVSRTDTMEGHQIQGIQSALHSTTEETIVAIKNIFKKKVLTETNPNAIMFLEISSKGALYEKLRNIYTGTDGNPADCQ